MPLPIIFLIGILVGYPLIQLVAALFARRRKTDLAKIRAELACDEQYDSSDLEAYDKALQPASGGRLLFWALPVVMPVAIVWFAIEIVLGRVDPSIEGIERQTEIEHRELRESLTEAYGKSSIFKDARYAKANDLEFEIGLLSSPVPVLLAMGASVIVSPIFFFVYGVRGPLTKVVKEFLRQATDSVRLIPVRLG